MQGTNETILPADNPVQFQTASTISIKPKSYIVAGLLAIFFGQLGVHGFYLRRWGLAWAHLAVVLLSGALLTGSFMVAIMAPQSYSLNDSLSNIFTMVFICSIGSTINGIWALVDGIIILAQGKNGMLRHGYAVRDTDGSILVPMEGVINNGQQHNQQN